MFVWVFISMGQIFLLIDYIAVFCAQFLPIYVNPRNDKIQAHYHHIPQIRSRQDFLKLLQEQSHSIVLKDK
jgi:hypothetical protein